MAGWREEEIRWEERGTQSLLGWEVEREGGCGFILHHSDLFLQTFIIKTF